MQMVVASSTRSVVGGGVLEWVDVTKVVYARLAKDKDRSLMGCHTNDALNFNQVKGFQYDKFTM